METLADLTARRVLMSPILTSVEGNASKTYTCSANTMKVYYIVPTPTSCLSPIMASPLLQPQLLDALITKSTLLTMCQDRT